MTSGDKDHMDTELEALLQALPNPRPSAALDAAILADAEAALAAEPFPKRLAANDAVTPESATAVRANFMARWKVPLAFAATVMLAVHVVGLQWFASPVYDAPPVPASKVAADTSAIAKPSAAPPTPTSAAAPATASAPTVLSDQSTVRQPDQASTTGARPKAAVAPQRARLLEPEVRAGRDQPGSGIGASRRESGATAKTGSARAPAPPAPAAPATAPAAMALVEPAPSATAFAPGEMRRAAPAAAAAAPVPSSGEPLAEAARQAPGPAGLLAKKGSPPAVAGTVAKGLSMDGVHDRSPQANAGSFIGGVTAHERQAVAASSDVSSAAVLPARRDARTSLVLIEKLLKADLQQQALDEWAWFRKNYPDYAVPVPLLQQIEALKK